MPVVLEQLALFGNAALKEISALNAQDIASIGTLVLLEALLSADNALVLALIARRLPNEADRNKALNIGIALSFVFRALGLLLAKLIIRFWFFQALGSGYLLYLAINHFREKFQGGHDVEDHKDDTHPVLTSASEENTIPVTPTIVSDVPAPKLVDPKLQFRNVVIALTFTDIAFAVDSILAAVALTDKLWVIYAGVLLGIIALRLVSGAFIRLLERYPALADMAYALVAWAGLKLGLGAVELFGETLGHHWNVHMDKGVFWIGIGVIVALGSLIASRKPKLESEG